MHGQRAGPGRPSREGRRRGAAAGSLRSPSSPRGSAGRGPGGNPCGRSRGPLGSRVVEPWPGALTWPSSCRRSSGTARTWSPSTSLAGRCAGSASASRPRPRRPRVASAWWWSRRAARHPPWASSSRLAGRPCTRGCRSAAPRSLAGCLDQSRSCGSCWSCRNPCSCGGRRTASWGRGLRSRTGSRSSRPPPGPGTCLNTTCGTCSSSRPDAPHATATGCRRRAWCCSGNRKTTAWAALGRRGLRAVLSQHGPPLEPSRRLRP
mmetsp:Transcript_76971/g.215075  ORF Transcript_76971/g.215075 Transcript_76971/m.215075 type:complete len:263 (+) Transcript_76971:187-975(+)